jgi:hypothetical protein
MLYTKLRHVSVLVHHPQGDQTAKYITVIDGPLFVWFHNLLSALQAFCILGHVFHSCGRSQWPCGPRRGSTAARLLGLWIRIPPRAWMSVSCECCELSGRDLCDGLVPRSEESYRVWCVWSVIVKPRTMRRPRPPRGWPAIEKKNPFL